MDQSDFNLIHQNQSTESKIVASLERISQAFRVLLWEQSKEFSLSPIQVQVLIFLLHHSPEKRKVSYLADEFNMTKATVSDTVKTLLQKGLIIKEQQSGDTRSFTIYLSEKGREIAQKTSHFTKEIRSPIQKLDTADKETLMQSLFDIIQHLNKSGVITQQRMCATCAHFRASVPGQSPYCNLIGQPLKNADLRIDCPEHKMNY